MKDLEVTGIASFRERIINHPKTTLAGTVILLALSQLFMLHPGGFFAARLPEPKVWFLAEDSDQQIVRPATDISPLSINGVTYVRAYYFSTGVPTEKTSGYLQKLSPEARALELQRRKGAGGAMLPMLHEGYLLRGPDKQAPWVEAASAAGRAIVAVIRQSAGAQVREITP